MLASRGVEWSAIEKQFFQYTKENGKDFPMNIGERASTDDKVNMLLFLVRPLKFLSSLLGNFLYDYFPSHRLQNT